MSKPTHKLSVQDDKEHWEELIRMRTATIKHINPYLKEAGLQKLSTSKLVLEVLEKIHPDGLFEMGKIPHDVLKKFKNDVLNGNIKVLKEDLKSMKL